MRYFCLINCFIFSERWARLTTNSIMLNENLAIGTDKNGNIFGSLYDQGTFSYVNYDFGIINIIIIHNY